MGNLSQCAGVDGGSPPDVLALVRLRGILAARLSLILTEVRELLIEQHPDYADYLAEEFDEVVATARSFVDHLLATGPVRSGNSWPSGCVEQELFVRLGRAHFDQRRDVKDLLAAYRSGAAVAWRHISRIALELGVRTEMFAGVAGAVFTAVDELSAASLRGYLQRQSEIQTAIDQCRHELVELLLSGHADPTTVRDVAARAAWKIPTRAAVVLVDAPDDVAPRFDGTCLVAHGAVELVAVVPDPTDPGRAAQLAKTLRGFGAVIGPAVGLVELPDSRRLAARAVDLRRAGVLRDDPLFVADHLDALVVHQDARLLAALRRRHLQPLLGLPPTTRERLTDTLRAWLLYQGNQKEMAAELRVHPQTVRYRLGQLRDLLGPALDEPDVRGALLLSLAWSGHRLPDPRDRVGGHR